MMKFKKKYILLPVLAVLCGYMLYSVYIEVKLKTIHNFNAQQIVLARQAAKGIEGLFNLYYSELRYISGFNEIVLMNKNGKKLMHHFYKDSMGQIKAITRVDEKGHIIYTVPYNKKAIGADISHQKHIHRIMKTHQPVISDVFTAVQGYKAVAYHVPVIKNGIYKGTIAILIPFKNIARKYLADIKTGENGYAWMISQKGVELYCPCPGHVGKNVFETSKKFPSVLSMAMQMMKGKKGITIYYYDHIKGNVVEKIKKHAAYYPVQLGNTLWSIVVATPEKNVLATMKKFRNKWFLIIALLIVTGILYSFYVIKAWGILMVDKERKASAKVIKESEKRYRTLFEAAGDAIFIMKDNIFVDCNLRALELFGCTREQIVGKPPYQFSPPIQPDGMDSKRKSLDKIRAAFDKKTQFFEWRHAKYDGSVFDSEVSLTTIELHSGTHIQAIVRDVTERKNAQKALKESEEKFRTVAEQSPNMIFINQKGKVVYCNEKCEESVGYQLEEFYSPDFDFFTLIAPESKALVVENFKRHMAGEDIEPYEYTLLDKKGNRIHAIITSKLIQYGKEKAILGIVTDITEKKLMESRLQHAQKMEGIGTLAGGIAHDFNNLLMGIQGSVSLILFEKTPGHPDYDRLKNIEEYIRQGSGLTKQLLGFARGGKYEVETTDLNELVKGQNRMFGEARKEIKIHDKYEPSLWHIRVDRGQIKQVLLNLYVNAWQAMPQGGKIFVQTQNVTLGEDITGPFNLRPGRYVNLSVTDTGIGMDEDIINRIFDPFFTTREMGRGTGLGLSSVYGIIKNHTGFITAESEKGKGSTFNIYLPALDTKIMENKVENEKTADIFRGNETILLVDDEDMIIDVGKAMLEKLEYKVLVARSGKEALDIYRKNNKDINMVILDMIMPEMGGGEVFDRLKEIDPDITVLLSSGYSIDGQAQEILDRGCKGFIQKPFNMKSLSEKLRHILDFSPP